MTQCSAFGCKNKGMHVFPKDPKRRKLWERALRRKNWKATNTSRLCSSHFKSDDYYGISAYTGNEPLAKFLKRTAIPSVFSFSKTETPLAKERQARIENRNRRTLLTSTETPSTSIETPCTSSHIENVEDTIEVSTIEGIHQFPQNIIINPTNEQGTQVNIEHVYGCIKRFVNDDQAISFYTGFESYSKFYFVYSTLSPMASNIQYYGSNVINISTEDQFFLTMIKLRQDRCNFELSRFFNISQTTVSNVFITFINFIHQLWSRLNIWPDKDLVEYYTPDSFRKYSSCTHVILDGTEIKVQKPQNPVSQQASWSSYKHANTLKVLVGATPGGLLSYCSEAYGGSVSDRQTVERSNLLQKCDPGDSILADRGFNIQDLFAGKDITVNIPTFLKGKSQIPRLTVLHDRKLASKRVHIECLIGLISDGYGLDLSTSMLDVDWVDSIKTNNLNSLFASINIIFIFIAMIEVCIDSLESAINAVHGGADELEVCSSLTEGGLTPSPGFVKQIVGMVNNIAVGKPIRKSCHDCGCDKLTKRPKVNVMIRCRTGSDFHYSVEEMDTMISDVDVFKTFGVDRFVFGALTETQHIDVINCERLIRQAYPIPVTFHRAFDVCMNPLLSIAKIAELGFNRLLTSGQKPTANDVEAIQLIKSLISSAGDKVEIMPGAGINLDNAKIFIDIGCKIVHSSCKIIRYLPQIKNGLSMGTSDSEHVFVTDENIVKKMKEIVNEN